MKNDLFKFYDNILTYKLFNLSNVFNQIEFEAITHNIPFHDQISYEEWLKTQSRKASRGVLQEMENEILQEPTLERQKLFRRKIESDIAYYINKLGKEAFIAEHPYFLKDLENIAEDVSLKLAYILPLNEDTSKPKIKWLGNIKLLTTLIFDLSQGQDKKPRPALKPLIEAQKKDLIDLLISNFLDSKGNTLKESTLSDYLNTSEEKSTTRLPKGERIEMEY